MKPVVTQHRCVVAMDSVLLVSLAKEQNEECSFPHHARRLICSSLGLKALTEDILIYRNLEVLQLDGNNLVLTDGGPLSYLRNLRELSLAKNHINTICGLNSLKKLETLNLSHNRITEVEGLKWLTSLASLDISYNKLEKSSSIEHLTSAAGGRLQHVDISFNSLRGDAGDFIKIFASIPELKTLTFRDNPVSDSMPSYRKTMIVSCRKLVCLEGRPLMRKEREYMDVWAKEEEAEVEEVQTDIDAGGASDCDETSSCESVDAVSVKSMDDLGIDAPVRAVVRADMTRPQPPAAKSIEGPFMKAFLSEAVSVPVQPCLAGNMKLHLEKVSRARQGEKDRVCATARLARERTRKEVADLRSKAAQAHDLKRVLERTQSERQMLRDGIGRMARGANALRRKSVASGWWRRDSRQLCSIVHNPALMEEDYIGVRDEREAIGLRTFHK